MVTELQKSRNFIREDIGQRGILENELKRRYVITDHENGRGYLIDDTQTGTQVYFGPNPRLTLETRYLEKDEDGNVMENILDLFTRVAVNIAEADLKYDPEKDIRPVAEEFLESLVHKQFMPNTPTLCNAGRSLQQLSACFVLPVEDYLATDDLGEDPEKQGCGIYDTERYMSMVHKSGGGTGFNFSHLRPRSDRISTTFGSSSGPVSFMKSYDGTTDAVNQGGFRRGANMGILNYDHPDIFEFVSEKTRDKKSLTNFNLSVGVDDYFMGLVKTDGYFRMINPKDEKKLDLEKRVWKNNKLLQKGTKRYDKLFSEIEPSLIISEDGKKVINTYDQREVGKVDEDGTVLISARELFNYVSENAWTTGCPGIIFLDRLERNNKTPHVGKIESTNPCGEQPLLPFEACNLGAINLASCVRDGQIDYQEIDRRVRVGVHFLDNTIDMSKFPFQKIYGMVHGNRKIGLGLMGWAETLSQLNISYDSEDALKLARELSRYITNTARKESGKIAEERGVFPFWEGSVWERENKKVRNATVTTIAPNGTTGMICDVNGGIEPFYKIAFKKTCMDGKELVYRVPSFEHALRKQISNENELEKILYEVDKKGAVQDVEGVPENLKAIYKTAHDISPEWHVKMQAAFQSGIDNAVSKTVNLPKEATVEDVARIYRMAYDEGCVGITIFRDQCKQGVYSTLDSKIKLIQNRVKSSPVVDRKPQSIKYKVKRQQTGDSLHVILTSELYVNDKTHEAFFIPSEDFQVRAPLGESTSVSFAQSGIDRTEIFRGPDPDYAEIILRLQSASSNEEEGLGPRRIKSIEHAVGLTMEDYLLRNGVVERDETGRLRNKVRKPELRKVEQNTEEFEEIMSQVRVYNNEAELEVFGHSTKLGKKFVCERCGCEEYTFIAGCSHPVCKQCGESSGGNCG